MEECWGESLLVFSVVVFSFHCSEVLLVWLYNPQDLCWSSTLITWPYVGCVSLSLIEYTVESYYFPAWKCLWWIWWPALLVALLGEGIRKAGMVTAGRHFTHLVQYQKRPGHELIQHGIYRFVRHPGYLGFLVFAVGLQVMLHNPLSAALFIGYLVNFFADRVETEEFYLIQFFGPAYWDYKRRVWSGILCYRDPSKHFAQCSPAAVADTQPPPSNSNSNTSSHSKQE